MSKFILRFYWYIIVVFIAVCVAYGIVLSHRHKPSDVKVVEQTTLQSPASISKELVVSRVAAREIAYQVQEKKQPVEKYVMPSVTAAVEREEVNMKANRADKVLVTAKPGPDGGSEGVTVEAYRINLKKAHEIKAGMSYINNKVYMNVGYRAGRGEVIMHYRPGERPGFTGMYCVAEW